MQKINHKVKVLLPLLLPEAFTYLVPNDFVVNKGDFVQVPLGNKKVAGVVWDESGGADVEEEKLKAIIKKYDIPAMKNELMKLIDWVADYTISPKGNVLKMAMTNESSLSYEEFEIYLIKGKEPDVAFTRQRKKAIECLNGNITKKNLHEISGVGTATINSLIKEGYILEKKVKIADKVNTEEYKPANVKLSKEQEEAADFLKNALIKHEYKPVLLDGVTGAGKTEVYFAVIEEALRLKDAQVLILLPEIILTAQVLERFRKRFGFEATSWHSGLTQKQREKNWHDIAFGKARVVIGARSALFLPYKNLRLIIIDEEHDSSYKQEEGVIYNARDMAVVYASILSAPIVLSSATPSVETFLNAQSEKYTRIHLPSRHGGAALPDILVIDMRNENIDKGCWLSNSLKKAIALNIEDKKQTALFLNRRGYAPMTLCRKCGHRFCCPHCSSWLVEHKSKGKLLCHHCEYSASTPKACPECKSENTLAPCGPGVERIEEEVKNAFPNARAMLMTSDNLTTPKAMEDAVNSIINGEVDIIIGTQIIAKGHHFPNLTLVGIIDADLGLEGGDLRASERTYQLLHQVSGRAGRESHKGRVIIQSYMPDNMIIKALSDWDREKFFAHETKSRKITTMPPYSRLASLIFKGKNETEVFFAAKNFVKTAPVAENIEVLGPAQAQMYRVRGDFRYRVLIKSPRNVNLQKWLKQAVFVTKVPNGVKIKVDIDPYSFL